MRAAPLSAMERHRRGGVRPGQHLVRERRREPALHGTLPSPRWWESRQYRPHFDLWTIWGAFSSGALPRNEWCESGSARPARWSCEAVGSITPILQQRPRPRWWTVDDDGWRLGVGASFSPNRQSGPWMRDTGRNRDPAVPPMASRPASALCLWLSSRSRHMDRRWNGHWSFGSRRPGWTCWAWMRSGGPANGCAWRWAGLTIGRTGGVRTWRDRLESDSTARRGHPVPGERERIARGFRGRSGPGLQREPDEASLVIFAVVVTQRRSAAGALPGAPDRSTTGSIGSSFPAASVAMPECWS